MELDPSREDLEKSITMTRWSPTLNDCGKMLAVFTSMPLETQIPSNRLDVFTLEVGGTIEGIAVM